MNDSKLTIRWIKNDDCTINILVCGEVDSYPYFKEAFLSLDRPTPVRDISEKELNKTFIFSDLLTIRKFADIIGIDIDERKFRDRREFQRYFREIMKAELGKEDL